MSKDNNFQEYVVGFCFDVERERVVLIRKLKPAWQAGKLNGVGGKVELNETHIQAMVREFAEETGVTTEPNDWMRYAKLSGKYFDMQVFCMFDNSVLTKVKTVEDEKVEIHWLDSKWIKSQAISNLPWLISLALDTDQPRIFVEAAYESE